MKTNFGFSLIEMIIYVAILVLMLAVVVEVVLSVARNDRIISAVKVIENSAITTNERIGREIREAESVASTTSIFNTHPGKLILTQGSTTTEFYLSNNRIYLKENGVVMGALTEADARATSLIFRYYATSTSERVRVEMTIEAGTSTHYRVENFYSSAVTR